MAMTEESAVLEYVREHSIAWYVLAPGQSVQWPAMLGRYVDYQCDDYKVYGFVGAP